MKLIDREPTPRMIEAMQMDQFHMASYVKTLFQAAYDAAPEVQQEPVARVTGYFGGRLVIEPLNPAAVFLKDTALYIFPPDAQAEIAKRDERIAKLLRAVADHVTVRGEQSTKIARLQREVANRNARALEGDKAIAIRETLLDQIMAHEQSIARLKAVIGRCKEVLDDVHSWVGMAEGAFDIVEEALAAIKEIEK